MIIFWLLILQNMRLRLGRRICLYLWSVLTAGTMELIGWRTMLHLQHIVGSLHIWRRIDIRCVVTGSRDWQSQSWGDIWRVYMAHRRHKLLPLLLIIINYVMFMVLTTIAVLLRLLVLRLLAIVKLTMVWTLIWKDDRLWRIHMIHFTNWCEVIVHR